MDLYNFPSLKSMAYNYKLNLKKAAIAAAMGAMAAVVALMDGLDPTTIPLGDAIIITLVVGAIKGLENFLKHFRDD